MSYSAIEIVLKFIRRQRMLLDCVEALVLALSAPHAVLNSIGYLLSMRRARGKSSLQKHSCSGPRSP